jgi:hypothetical protein
MPHLVVSISGHGFDHVAQTAPVLNRLHHLMPQLRITVRTVECAATATRRSARRGGSGGLVAGQAGVIRNL